MNFLVGSKKIGNERSFIRILTMYGFIPSFRIKGYLYAPFKGKAFLANVKDVFQTLASVAICNLEHVNP